MKLYNKNTDKIEVVEYIIDNGIKYPDKLTESQLNFYGYYKISYGEQPNTRYYTYTENKEIIDNLYTITYIPEEKLIADVQNLMKIGLTEAFSALALRPEVDSTLGYNVDGGRKDLENFKIGQEFDIPQVKDANGIMHDITDSEYDIIISAIKLQGITLYQQKWAKELEIEGFTTVDECIYYEATPYQEEILDEDGNSTGEFKTKYKNNTTDWS